MGNKEANLRFWSKMLFERLNVLFHMPAFVFHFDRRLTGHCVKHWPGSLRFCEEKHPKRLFSTLRFIGLSSLTSDNFWKFCHISLTLLTFKSLDDVKITTFQSGSLSIFSHLPRLLIVCLFDVMKSGRFDLSECRVIISCSLQ
jgi:hypothetical protein